MNPEFNHRIEELFTHANGPFMHTETARLLRYAWAIETFRDDPELRALLLRACVRAPDSDVTVQPQSVSDTAWGNIKANMKDHHEPRPHRKTKPPPAA